MVLPDTHKFTFLWNGSDYTAQLLCFMVTELFKVKTWFSKSSYCSRVFGYHCSFQNYNYRYLFHTSYENINQELSKVSYSRCVVKIRIRKLKFLFSVQLPIELLRYFLFKIFVNSVLQSSFVDTSFNKIVFTI